ncbi:serine hydrolase domain-containing protein [Clostridium paraputrificum]|uniref:serine hydrolase domain-containing protein n=1 Tax=Clostridium TaxID=1485 RepID=UPI003D35447B
MNIFKKCISVFLLSTLITASSIANVSSSTKVPKKDKDVAKMMNDYMNELNTQYPFSGTVLVSQKEKIIFRKAYGKADYENNIPNTPKTKFSIASMTKSFTAIGIMILQESGELNVKDYISKYIPDFPNGDKITIENLLTHTSGIPDYFTWDFCLSEESKKRQTPEEIINLFKNQPLSFEPGKQYQYCNSNYALLGYIIEIVSGGKYEDFLADNIFDPLDMKDTGFYLDLKNVKNKSRPYQRSENILDNSLQSPIYANPTSTYAAGGMYSTIDDLYLWNRALSDGRLLTQESLDQMYKRYLPEIGYGYGFVLDNVHGQKCISHSGSLPGVDSYILRFIDEDTCIIILSNLKASKLAKMETNLYSILHEGKYETPEQFKEVNIDSNLLDNYTGKYEFAPGYDIEVIKKDNGLSFVTKSYGISPSEFSTIFPCSEKKFFHKYQDLNIEFMDIQNGKSQKAIVTTFDMPIEFRRID